MVEAPSPTPAKIAPEPLTEPAAPHGASPQ